MHLRGSTGQFAVTALAVMCLVLSQPAIATSPLSAILPAESGKKVLLKDVPTDIVPNNSNLWKCACDGDGCWPGCFTVASAVVLKYWAAKGYSNLWDGSDDNGGLFRLREVLPNMLCYGNGTGNGKPGETGYDAQDVAGGLREWTDKSGYSFKLVANLEPTFEEIVREIDSGRPVIGAFGESPWGSHAGTIVGYDTTNGRKAFVVRPNYANYPDMTIAWNGASYRQFSIVTVEPTSARELLLDLPPLNFDLVVNSSNPDGFSLTGDWTLKPGFGHEGAALTAWSPEPADDSGDEDPASVRWSPVMPFDGMWEVMAWMPTDEPDANLTQAATYQVLHAEGQALARRSQKDAVQGWMSLGVHPFKKGQRADVYLGTRTGDKVTSRVWADAVKFAWRAPLLVRPDNDARQTFVVHEGRLRRIPENDTFGALRFNPNLVRKLPELMLKRYSAGDPLPSIYTQWVGQYFNNANLSAPAAAVRTDNKIDFRWTGRAPAPNMSELGYSVRWSRMLALTEGNYTFKLEAVGGVRVWMDGRLIVDAWQGPDNILVQHEGTASVKTGLHRIEVEYVMRSGMAQIRMSNLPPAVPLIPEESNIRATASQTTTLQWLDGGDPDGSAGQRRFYASIWRAGDGFLLNSDWISTTQWTVPLPLEGRYFWRVAASDGDSTSEFSQPRELVVDRMPPWAQMKDAKSRSEGGFDPASGKVISPVLAGARGISLTWEGKDDLSGIAGYDVQAREVLRSGWQEEAQIKLRLKTALKYELVLSGTQEITRAVVVTQMVPFSTTERLRTFTPISGTWKTVATGVKSPEMVYFSTPGSAYEFRVRARDAAGNTQQWYEGYSVFAQSDPNEMQPPQGAGNRVMLPVVVR